MPSSGRLSNRFPDSAPAEAAAPRRFTLRGILAILLLFCALLGLSIQLESPGLFASGMVTGSAVLLWEIVRPSLAGVAFGTLALQLAVLAGVSEYYNVAQLYGYDFLLDFGPALFIGPSGLLMASTIFALIVCDESRPNYIAAAFFAVVWLAGLFVGPPVIQAAQGRAVAHRSAENTRLLTGIVDDVTALCADQGDAPANQRVLVKLLGKPLPLVGRWPAQTEVHYERLGPGHFQLTYYDFEHFAYDSANPQAGWVAGP